jgi:large subunit ribosomal protein L23
MVIVAVEQSNTLSVYNVIMRAHVTEKATHLVERGNKYTFLVNRAATKIDIRAAVEELWSVRVVDVKTINRVGKPRRHKMRETNARDTKKAIVTLHSEDRIAFF